LDHPHSQDEDVMLERVTEIEIEIEIDRDVRERERLGEG
jgi:hypothetical protein